MRRNGRGDPAAKIGLICNALEVKQPCCFKAFRLRSIGGQYDLTCAHQNGPRMAYRWTQRSQDGRPTPRRSCPGFFCSAKLCCHARGPRPSCGTRWKCTPASRLYASSGSENGHDNPCCYMTALLLASVPFLSGGSAACPPREGVGERIGKEWVIDKSLIDFSVFTYIFILLHRIYLRKLYPRLWTAGKMETQVGGQVKK